MRNGTWCRFPSHRWRKASSDQWMGNFSSLLVNAKSIVMSMVINFESSNETMKTLGLRPVGRITTALPWIKRPHQSIFPVTQMPMSGLVFLFVVQWFDSPNTPPRVLRMCVQPTASHQQGGPSDAVLPKTTPIHFLFASSSIPHHEHVSSLISYQFHPLHRAESHA